MPNKTLRAWRSHRKPIISEMSVVRFATKIRCGLEFAQQVQRYLRPSRHIWIHWANKISAQPGATKRQKILGPLHSFSLLKIALIAYRCVLLDDEVQEFLEDAETGLVYPKKAEVLNSWQIRLRPRQHVGFKWFCIWYSEAFKLLT